MIRSQFLNFKLTWKAVSKGPETFAGSKPNLWAAKGTKVPNVELISIEQIEPAVQLWHDT